MSAKVPIIRESYLKIVESEVLFTDKALDRNGWHKRRREDGGGNILEADNVKKTGKNLKNRKV